MRRPVSFYSLVTVLAVCVAFALPARAADATKKKTGRRVITVKTCYLHETLEGAHQLILRADMHDFTGKLTLDPNTCALNDFGDPTVCTKIAPRTIDVKLDQVRLKDPSGQNRKLFNVVGKGLANRLLLVVPTKPGSAFRFVSKDRGGVRRVVTLEMPAGRGTPCCGESSGGEPGPKPKS